VTKKSFTGGLRAKSATNTRAEMEDVEVFMIVRNINVRKKKRSAV